MRISPGRGTSSSKSAAARYAARVAASDGEVAAFGGVSSTAAAVVDDAGGDGIGVVASTGGSSSGVGGDMAGVQHENVHRLGFRIGWGLGCPGRGLPDPVGPLSRFCLNSTIFKFHASPPDLSVLSRGFDAPGGMKPALARPATHARRRLGPADATRG